MNTNIKTSEEFKGIVTIYLVNGHTINIPTTTLIDHIEDFELNLTDFTGGEIYPPASASDWMDVNENFDKAVSSYYTNIICK